MMQRRVFNRASVPLASGWSNSAAACRANNWLTCNHSIRRYVCRALEAMSRYAPNFLRRFAYLCLFIVSLANAGKLFAQISASEVATKLDALKEIVAKEVTTELQRTNFTSSYTTVWRASEDGAIEALEKVLPKHIPELTGKNFDAGKTGSEKNRLADLAIVVGTNQIEVSIKAARSSGQPANELGTFH